MSNIDNHHIFKMANYQAFMTSLNHQMFTLNKFNPTN